MKAKLFSLVSIILLSIGASYADKVQIGDLYYNLGDPELTAEVTQSDDNYSGLTEINIPASVSYANNQYLVVGIGERAFSNCSSLLSVTIPSSVTSIGPYTFSNCSGLTTIEIPSSVTSIDKYAFRACSGLTSITCRAANVPLMGANVFTDVDKSIPVYVPSESIEAYKVASGWSEFTNIQAIDDGGSSGGNTPMFPGDPGTMTYGLELKAAVVDGEELTDYAPSGAGGYPAGTEVTVTAQDIPGYAFVRWSDEVTDKTRTVIVNESMTLTALYSHSMIEIAIAAGQWNFICLPPLGDRQYTEEMFTYDGLSGVKWGTYNGEKRAAGQSGWETPETFNAMQGYILYSTTAGTLRINAYEDEIRQGESGSAFYAGMTAYAASHPENESWNFLGNPYNQGYNIAGLAVAGLEAPITVWNGTAYSTYTPGIDEYTLQPFEAFFIQKGEGTEGITFSPEYLEGEGSVADALGTLHGYFSVSATRKVRFSKGNLQYQASTNTWRFAENQYDTIGALNLNISPTYDGWIDLFGFGTGDDPTKSSTDYLEYWTFTDWGTNAISNGGNQPNVWRSLTYSQLEYLFLTRENAASLFGMGSVNGINGTFILPDDWVTPAGVSFIPNTMGLFENTNHYYTTFGDNYTRNNFTLAEWAILESAGAVFLPASGNRNGAKIVEKNNYGCYWSGSVAGTSDARSFWFNPNSLYPQYACNRQHGLTVRLVR